MDIVRRKIINWPTQTTCRIYHCDTGESCGQQTKWYGT